MCNYRSRQFSWTANQLCHILAAAKYLQHNSRDIGSGPLFEETPQCLHLLGRYASRFLEHRLKYGELTSYRQVGYLRNQHKFKKIARLLGFRDQMI
jgi:hypothetical protein